MPVYPLDCEVIVKQVAEVSQFGYNLSRFSMSAHAGTHIDAPFHFVADGRTIDQVPLDVLVGPAEVLGLGELAPNAEITPAMLEPFADRVLQGSRVLLRTGWSKHFGKPEFFKEHPNLTHDAAQWLVDRKIALLGVEQPSVNTKDNLAVHRIVLGAGIPLIETMTNLDKLTQDKVYLVALPLNLVGSDGAPIRVIAVEGDL